VERDKTIYLVLEYGEIDLATMLSRKQKLRASGEEELDENFVRLYWQQMLQAVATIHNERIVHSDLKPANFIFVKGQLKLLDFGIAKSMQADTTSIVRENQVGPCRPYRVFSVRTFWFRAMFSKLTQLRPLT
jgi:serine/threonine-protein kinase TTK/MPS1